MMVPAALGLAPRAGPVPVNPWAQRVGIVVVDGAEHEATDTPLSGPSL